MRIRRKIRKEADRKERAERGGRQDLDSRMRELELLQAQLKLELERQRHASSPCKPSRGTASKGPGSPPPGRAGLAV